MATFGRLLIAGVAGIVLFKVLLSVFGLAIGLLAIAIKVTLIALVVYFLWKILGDRRRKAA